MGRTIARGLGYGDDVPPKNLLKVYGLIFAIGLAIVVVVTLIVISTGVTGAHKPARPEVDRASLVRVQVRARQRVEVTMNGRPKGMTPVMLLVPRSETPLEVAVTLGGRVLTKQVTPRADQVVDFP